MENILWNTWQYLVDVFDCFLILYLFRKMMRTRLRQPKYYYLFLPVLAAVLFACNCWCKRAGRMRTRAERTCKKLFFPANRIIKPFFG